jgi:phospholipid/cholesterol/gamma-HCH transport system substrate-binding protein
MSPNDRRMPRPQRQPRRHPRPRHRPRVAALAALAATVVLAGCQGAFDLPLPGGAAQHGDVIRVTAEFADVLDLVPQAAVKVDEVTVGSVERIELNGWTARVTLRLPRSTTLPDNAIAEIRQTSLLGEKYVELSPPPASAPEGRLGDGDNIPLARTGRNPEVEEVLSAMSLLLNGGGVAQLKTIETELGEAMHGNEARIRDVLAQLDTFVGGLDRQKSEIVRALDGIDALSTRLAAQKDVLARALESMPAGLKVLADQRRQLVQMLQALSRLGAVGTGVIEQSKADTAANLAALQPILAQLTRAGDALPKSMQLLLTYPFSDATTGAMKGDYTNMVANLQVDLSDPRSLLGSAGSPTSTPSGSPTGGLPGVPSLPGLPVPTGSVPVPSLPGASPTSSSGGGVGCPPLCLGSSGSSGSGGPDGAASDGSWRSLYRSPS